MNEIDKMVLLDLGKETIKGVFDKKDPDLKSVKHLSDKRRVFVTLKKRGSLRGAMGILDPLPMYEGVMEAAKKAAFEDPRFSPLLSDELRYIKLEISIIEDPVPILVSNPDDYPDNIKVGEDGLLMEGAGKALLLPQVAEEKGYTSVQFFNALAQAGGLSFNGWKDPRNKIYKFKAHTFSE